MCMIYAKSSKTDGAPAKCETFHQAEGLADEMPAQNQ